jgi:hypothetical protein
MRVLTAPDILRVWEQGQPQHPVDRALTLLVAGFPGRTREELASLSIGQRDADLLDLREGTFGPLLNCYEECPQCGGRLEFTFTTNHIRVPPSPEGEKKECALAFEDWEVKFVLPATIDLAAVAGSASVEGAHALLMKRCILASSRTGAAVPFEELPEEILLRLAARVAECDPQAEVLLDLRCPVCSHAWQRVFDIVSFFWREICAQAKGLMCEVHALARAYGWREADILSMNPSRRQFYLGKVT